MKKTVFFLAALGILAVSTCAFAHPPKSLSLSWDKGQETLHVTAEHNVNDTGKHFIASLTVFDGNKKVITKEYSQQNSPEIFSDNIQIKGIAPGTKLRVQIVCNIMGSKEAEIVVQ